MRSVLALGLLICRETTDFSNLRSQRRPCRAEIEEKLLPLLRPGVRTSLFPRSARHARYRHSLRFVCRLRVPETLDQSPVLRAPLWRSVTRSVSVFPNSQIEPTPMQPSRARIYRKQ
jgi:hypothetical protein